MMFLLGQSFPEISLNSSHSETCNWIHLKKVLVSGPKRRIQLQVSEWLELREISGNDCRVVLTFLQRSPSFSLASASRVQHDDNESWHARQRVYLTANTYNLNSYDSRTRAWADLFTQKKTVPQRCSSIAFDFFDLSSSNLVQESSVDLQPQQSRGLPHNALHFPSFNFKSFLQRSSSSSLASANRVQHVHDNESGHARQHAYLTNTY